MTEVEATFAVRADPDTQTRRRKIHCKQELIVSSLQRFQANLENIDEILHIFEGTSEMSLRLIDWFVTNYAKHNSISYILNGQEFLVYMNYKSQLKAYSKKLFDPFCRRERILFQIPGKEAFVTTVGKLNFFRWAIEKGILNYIQLNLKKIETEMNSSAREYMRQKKGETASSQSSAPTVSTRSSTRRRKVDPNLPNAKLMQKHDCTVEVRFD